MVFVDILCCFVVISEYIPFCYVEYTLLYILIYFIIFFVDYLLIFLEYGKQTHLASA